MAAESENGLQVQQLTAGYVKGMPIISDINLSMQHGEIVSIIGPNGAGKSTLLKAIAGLLRVESGSVSFDNRLITGIRPDKLSQSGVALVPQLDNIFRTMSVQQNLRLAARRCNANPRQAIESMLELFPVLAEKFNARAGSLSGGQRQFLAVAMALVSSPTLLLLDEPSAGLSPKAAQEVLGMLPGIARSHVAILMVEQNVKAALTVSDRAYVLAEGRNQYEGEASSLMNDPVLGEIYMGVRRVEAHATKSV
ncbi:ABC transporter ATP-binding protein [Granulosicoccus antarcticus]|uniref:High-affinity branched-chain amino acid transport ATP-binding protein LivF n=1 Tax=Granulosicoccus antarcticus IMCC3135 TaxID=1192854 RepID=A0A2Z2NLQ4_9GAMM|nr:ABC transporter ATP-binding protein [Granulosicoccus antarcticus]ASJ70708.1 High-affinity branched-chain amino acid transport ATP-binding protein LivF [Granulosicoccus antarcticus IMCC3135]